MMLMDIKRFGIVLFLVMFVFAGAKVVRAADENLDDATKARIKQAEQGPSTINTSKYPQAIQDIYTDIFSQKCTQCHHLSRPINSQYALPSEWQRYVKRMMHKPGSNINSEEAKKIFEFLVYDSSIRKKALVDDKLSKATADDKAADEAKVKEIRDKYDH